MDAMKRKNDGIWLKPVSEEDLLTWQGLVLGPALSPYAFGFFSFSIKFPAEYPSCAPVVHFLTTNGGKTRFNPNLYADGKVCLSILGTWRGESGELWSSVQNCHSVMVSIQSLLDDEPYHNEPGFEKQRSVSFDSFVTSLEGSAKASRDYNLKITHETVRVAVCDVLEEILNRSEVEEAANGFCDIIKWHFLLYCSRYLEIVDQHAEVEGEFEIMEFEYQRNWMSGSFNFKELRSRILLIKESLVKELVQWQREGVESSKHQSFACQHILSAFEVLDTKLIACISLKYCTDHIYIFQKWSKLSNAGISAAPREANKFVWDVTIMGDLDGGWYENGMYQLEITFPPNFPDCMPRPRFQTQMFHPQIDEDGFPFLSVSMTDSKNVQAIISDVHSLLKNPPSPDPRTWVNKKAADMYFGGDQEEFKRTVRRYAQRSMEQSKKIRDG
ncbi:hypothetical protein GUITHDRAFT_136110 [Guillardia theta CCMP2712]|uniref:Ubiquitin-conjugating enzyme E2 Z n=1 Tax=Guillardia theta (strain CCMP2712) TaxID=905079 RepID=L1JLM8_GUITC|nr:hypothetical protein GUITHDRAFT_136110 [Guillardia theta CCMP2712]EKX49446.1 hypothetical protein GUITHDRAFT_136110 [Guillardia theta CCMP2712]|eukprot:XP_005836426.1 hypothetical protein GUITHDRAFT_136110 [Guillardia theta CCMP2712]